MTKRLAAIIASAGILSACATKTEEPAHFGDVAEAATICPAGSLTAGIDVSEYQGTINWVTLKADTTNNIKWAYAKASEGLDYTDPQIAKNWPNMKAAGIIRGAYHFFHSSDNGTMQADEYLKIIDNAGGFVAGDLPPMLDWETTDSGSSASQADTNAQLFIEEIAAKTGMKTVIYTDFGFYNALTGTSGFSADQLWVANWPCSSPTVCTGLPAHGSCPNVDAPWSSWILWQWNDNEGVAGIGTGNPDGDVFNGTLAQLQTWAGGMTMMGSCPNGDGTYCGGDGNSETTGTLYNCAAGTFTQAMVCSNGCSSTPPGGSDACTPTTPGTTPIAQQSGNDAVTLANWPDKHMDLFVKSTGGGTFLSSTTTTGDSWTAPTQLATGEACGSAASFWGASWDYPELFSPLPNGTTDRLSWDVNAWTAFIAFDGTGLSHLTTAVGNDGRTNVFALGSAGDIFENTWDTTTSAWSGWTSLGGPTTTATFVTGAGAITWGNGTIEIFATDSSNEAWHAWYPNMTGQTKWSVWTKLGPGVATRPMPVRWADGTDGHAEVFARGTNGLLMHSEFDYSLAAGYPDWTAVDPTTQIIGEPMAIMNPSTGAEIFARDPAGTVLHATRSGTGYTALAPLGNQVSASDPFGWTRGDGVAEVFVIGNTSLGPVVTCAAPV